MGPITVYDLTRKAIRPGLTASSYKGPSLLQNIKRPTSTSSTPTKMPPKKTTSKPRSKTLPKDEPSYDHSPESTSDEDNSANIRPTNLGAKPIAPIREMNSKSGRGIKAKTATVNGHASRSSRDEQATSSPSLASTSSLSKRKSPAIAEDQFKRINMVDPFGRPPKKQKKLKVVYGSSQSRPSSHPKSSGPSKRAASPQPKGFQLPDDFDSDESPRSSQASAAISQGTRLLQPDLIESSPNKSAPRAKLTLPIEFENSPTSTPKRAKGFVLPDREDSVTSDLKSGDSFMGSKNLFNVSPTSTPPSLEKLTRTSSHAPSLKRDPNKRRDVKSLKLGGELTARIQGIVGNKGDEDGADGLSDEDSDIPKATGARCPMCHQACDISELKEWGMMNTRQQERFCRTHRKTNAEKKWDLKGYPKIDWEKLDSRILDHHEFIKSILSGEESHSRNTFEKLVAAGKGRSLRKMESNLIPGYYGARGLNTISGHVIHQFSDLLANRSMEDPLISKRGTTAFVQSVIVPEVAVRLIMEDMSIKDAAARVILAESCTVGELVHEEIKDVVIERVENSESEDNDEG